MTQYYLMLGIMAAIMRIIINFVTLIKIFVCKHSYCYLFPSSALRGILCGNFVLRQAGFQPSRQKFLCQVKESIRERSLGIRNGGITVDKAKDEAILKPPNNQEEYGKETSLWR